MPFLQSLLYHIGDVPASGPAAPLGDSRHMGTRQMRDETPCVPGVQLYFRGKEDEETTDFAT
jgi:hypothetical protein